MAFRGLVGAATGGRGAYVRGKSGYWWKEGATGLGSESDEVSRALNAYRASGGRRQVEHVYSARGTGSRIRSTGDLRAIRFRDEWGFTQYGWLDLRRNAMVSEEDIEKALKGVDSMLGLDAADEGSLQWKWQHASPAERAKMAERLTDKETVDWDDIFGEIFYSKEDELYKASTSDAKQIADFLSDVMDGRVAA